MDNKRHQAQVLNIARADHEILSFSIEQFRKMFIDTHPPVNVQELASTQRHITSKIAAHFAYEEEQVFPSLLADNTSEKVAHIVSELRQEHTILLTQARLVGDMLRSSDPRNYSNELFEVMMDFFTELEKHSTKEDGLLELFA